MLAREVRTGTLHPPNTDAGLEAPMRSYWVAHSPLRNDAMSVTEANGDAVVCQLVEGVNEVATVADRHDVAILALCDVEAK